MPTPIGKHVHIMQIMQIPPRRTCMQDLDHTDSSRMQYLDRTDVTPANKNVAKAQETNHTDPNLVNVQARVR